MVALAGVGEGCGPVRGCARSAPDGLRHHRAGRQPGQPSCGRVVGGGRPGGTVGAGSPTDRSRSPQQSAWRAW